MTVRVQVLFFARSREVCGVSERTLALVDGATTQTLLEQLITEYPALAEVMKTCVFAVNQEYLGKEETTPLKDGDEVAIIPPISGG